MIKRWKTGVSALVLSVVMLSPAMAASIVLTVSGGKVDVSINGSVVDSVEGEDFVKAMLGIWLGPKPPNGPLKKGILGG